MLFRQIQDLDSNTFTYLIGCPESRKALLIDPVLNNVERDLELLEELDLTLDVTLETHVHADHLTAAARLKALTGSQIAYPAMVNLECADIGIRENEPLQIGTITVIPLFTPGHTDHHFAYLVDNGFQKKLFSGDSLMIESCGRTDFQSGDAATLYRSIHEKLFTLPGETLLYPAHDYEGRFVSSIAQEKWRNPRLGRNRKLESFVELMESMDLNYPANIDFAVPGNLECGICPDNTPEPYQDTCSWREDR